MVNIGKTNKKFREEIRNTTFDVMKNVTKNRRAVIDKVSSKKLLKDMGIDVL